MRKLIQHHVKYLEIHGVDETVWLTVSEHVKLHKRLRREGKCNVPSDELKKIAMAAHNRTPKRRAARAAYNKSPKHRATQAAYDKSPKRRAAHAAYDKSPKRKATHDAYDKSPEGRTARAAYRKNIQSIKFSETPCTHVEFSERINYNHKTGTVSYIAGFYGTGGHKLPVVDIK